LYRRARRKTFQEKPEDEGNLRSNDGVESTKLGSKGQSRCVEKKFNFLK
jgi:hypothetical protein